MAVSAINVTRVSHNLRTMNLLETLRRNTVDIFTQQNRLATGKNLITSSDDPVAASQALRMNETISRQEQVLQNLQHADLLMGTSDDALNEINSLLIEAESIASQSLGSQSDAAERQANAAIIVSIRDRLVAVGNRQLRGSYIFAGRDTQQSPFISALGGVAYRGDTGDLKTLVGRGEEQITNVPGNVLFGALSTSVGDGVDLNPVLTRQTRLEDLSGVNGRGIRTGVFVISDGDGPATRIALDSADTVGDVIDMVGAQALAAGINLTLDISGGGLVAGGSGVSIRDTSSGTVASDLGITSDPGAPGSAGLTAPVADLGARVTPNTALASLNGGAGVPLAGGIRITHGNETTIIDTEGAVTVQDVTNRINAAGAFVSARVNDAGTGLELRGQVSGTTLSIGDAEGTTATALGIRTMNLSTPLADLNSGRGVDILSGQPDITINGRDGSSVDVSLDDAVTIGDVIERINQAALEARVSVTASISAASDGIRLTDTSGGIGALSVGRASVDAFAVDDLGLNKTVSDPDSDLEGNDVGGVRARGVFTALVDLERALLANDEQAIGIVATDIVAYSEDVTRVHGVVGARGATFRDRVVQTENAVVATRGFLSDIEDLDYTEAVTRFQQAQTALQANLLAGSQLLNLSLLDFIR